MINGMVIGEERNQIDVKLLASDVEYIPKYATPGAAGCDLKAAEDVVLKRGETKAVSTGIRVSIPFGYEFQVRPRSGMALKGVTVTNSPGTIDSDYRGEVKVILTYLGNGKRDWFKPDTFKIKRGDRIAQLVLAEVQEANFKRVALEESLGETSRGDGGFGSTGM